MMVFPETHIDGEVWDGAAVNDLEDRAVDYIDTKATTITATQQSGDYIFALTDVGTVVEGTKASSQTFTVPPYGDVAFPLGTVIEVFQDGAGQITIAPGTGVTLRSVGAKTKTAAQYATVGLRKRDTNEWVLSGSLAS